MRAPSRRSWNGSPSCPEFIRRSGRSVGTLLDQKFQKAVGFIGDRIRGRTLGEPCRRRSPRRFLACDRCRSG